MRPGTLVATTCAALAVAVGAPSAAHASSVTPPSSQRFAFDNTTQHFTVPAGVHQVRLTGWGGSGGTGGYESGRYAAPGGLGANVALDAAVNPGDVLVIEVGGQGGNATVRSAGVGANSSGSGQNGGRGGDINADPIGVDVDAAGNLYVSNQFGGVEEFLFPANGNRTPLATIAGPATGLSAPGRLAVAPPLSVRTGGLSHAQRGRRYRAQLRANLGTTPYRWRVAGGRLPHGVRLTRDGRLRGRPRQRGRFTFAIRVTDSSRPAMHAKRRLTLVVR